MGKTGEVSRIFKATKYAFTKRLLDLLDQRLNEVSYIVGNEYTVADIAILPWLGQIVEGRLLGAGEFL